VLVCGWTGGSPGCWSVVGQGAGLWLDRVLSRVLSVSSSHKGEDDLA